MAPGNYHYPDDPRYSDLFGCFPDRKVVTTAGEEEKGEDGMDVDMVKDGDGETKKKWEGILDIHNPCYSLGVAGVTPADMAQIQYQLFITKKKWCDYLITLYVLFLFNLSFFIIFYYFIIIFIYFTCRFDFDDAKPEKLVGVRMTRVYYNKKYWEDWLLPQLLEFSECLENKVFAPPLLPFRSLPSPLLSPPLPSLSPSLICFSDASCPPFSKIPKAPSSPGPHC